MPARIKVNVKDDISVQMRAARFNTASARWLPVRSGLSVNIYFSGQGVLRTVSSLVV
jgi:hypothetical protein